MTYLVDERGCWVWQRALDRGYGVMRTDGRMRKAYKVFYERTVGSVPEGLDLDHLCRNRACVNPDHLEPVTRAENIRRGTVAKLTVADAALIKASDLSWSKLARHFGVTKATVQCVKNGRTWREIAPASTEEASSLKAVINAKQTIISALKEAARADGSGMRRAA